MKRREFIKKSAAATGGIAFVQAGYSAGLSHLINKSGGDRPNILLIMTDQQTAKAMSCVDSKYLKTPSMDFLANNGTQYKRAYCNQPLCGPSRSSIFTGQLPHKVNVTVNMPEKEGYWSDVPMMGKLLKQAGYDTGYVGKWHMPQPVSDIDYHGFDYIVNTAQNNWVDPSIPKDCHEFLRKKRDNPFLLVASFTNPHDICEWARDYDLRQDPISEPPSPENCPPIPENYEIPEGEPEVLREQQKNSWKTYPTVDWEQAKWRQYRWAYNRLVEKVDYYIGMVIDSLKKFDQLEDTLIIFTSDHGDGVGSHRWNQKQVLYEEVINVPFIISQVGKMKPQVNNETLVANGEDILPTMLDYAKAKKPVVLDGFSLKSATDGNSIASREAVVIETEFANGTKSYDIRGRALISNDYKYIVYNKGNIREQLFNLHDDPGEMDDLKYSRKHKRVLKEYRERLAQWIIDKNDQFEMPSV